MSGRPTRPSSNIRRSRSRWPASFASPGDRRFSRSNAARWPGSGFPGLVTHSHRLPFNPLARPFGGVPWISRRASLSRSWKFGPLHHVEPVGP